VSFIETERLLLRAWMPSDAEAMMPIFGDAETMRYIGKGYQRGFTADETTRVVREMTDEYERSGTGVWPMVLKETGSIVGECGLMRTPRGDDVELSYIIAPEERRKGYAFEAASAVLDYGFGVQGLRRIVAFAHPLNTPSIRLINRLGMRFDRVERVYHVDALRYVKERS
jgi:RimJ/RimL family protein N-acetyltransferase